jgi:predicted nucleic acid-binding protein
VIVLDASVIIGHLDAGDAHHEASTALLLAVAADDLTVHPLTLAESLVSAARADRITEVVADLERLRIRQLAGDIDQPVRLAVLRATTRLKLPDCVVLDTARQTGATLATFDDTLRAAAAELGVRTVS